MKQPNLVLLLLATIAAIGLVLKHSQNSATDSAPVHARELSNTKVANPAKAETSSTLQSNSSHSTEAIGETLLRDYGNPDKPPRHDLETLSQLMSNFLLLVKSEADRPLSDNEDWARALLGANPAHERFLPEHSPVLNGNGQLIDRWGTPLSFHAKRRGHYAIRSAGPDRKMWTRDDIILDP
jgi:hypothetical protein